MSATAPTSPTSWWAALCHDPAPIGGVAVALMLGTYALLPVSPSVPLLVAGFCGATLVYGADRAFARSPEDKWNHPERRRWVRAHRGWLRGEAGLVLVVGGGALAFLRPETVLAAAGVAGLAGLHLVPMGRWGRPLKALGIGKPLLVAAAWAGGAVLLPVIEAGHAPGEQAWALAGYRLLFLLPNVMLADWGDRHGDAAAGLRSWGGTGRGVRWAATGLLLVAAAGALVAAGGGAAAGLLAVDSIGPLLLLGAVWTLCPTQPGPRLVMDGVVAWPLVTALVAWGMRVGGG